MQLQDYFASYKGELFRLVEGQHFIPTRKLVDSDDEHAILENILDRSKPMAPMQNSKGALHYLLFTPFRYPPLKGGGRFHTQIEQSIFYASEKLETAMAEVAYRRFEFTQHSKAKLSPITIAYTHFVVSVASHKTIYLTKEPFDEERAKISDPLSYSYAQKLGTHMREMGAELFTYFSARTQEGINVGIFSPESFVENRPARGKEKQWVVYADQSAVEFYREDIDEDKTERCVFKIADFIF
jgi:RES domain